MVLSLSFNNVKKSYFNIERGKRRSIFAPIVRKLVSIPHKPGAMLSSTDTDVRYIQQPFFIEGIDKFNLRKLEEDLSAWLITDEPKPLVFDDEPDRIYYAVVDGRIETDDVAANMGRGTITFLCLDPYKYGVQNESSVTAVSNPFVIRNEGTVQTHPTFEITLKAATTYLDIIGDTDYMRIGDPLLVEQTAFQKYEKLLNADGSNLTGWATAGFTPDGGAKAGTMSTSNGDFVASDFGTGAAWHGPAMSRSAGATMTNYIVHAYFDVRSTSGQRPRSEVYLLDDLNAIIGKISVVCRRATGECDVEINIRNGAKSYYMFADKWTFRDFFGYISITKEGNVFTGQIAQQGYDSNGNLYTRAKKIFTFNDLNSEYQKSLSSVGMHIGMHGTTPTPTQAKIRGLEVSRINQQTGVPYIGESGDVFIFDHKTSKITKNGDPFMLKDFGSRFFYLKKGDNIFVANPPSVISNIKVTWRDAYL